MSDGPVVIAEYQTLMEAQVLINRLEIEGVRAVPHNEQSVAVLSHMTAGIGGVGVLVAAEDADRARRIAREMQAEHTYGPTFGDDREFDCPACGEAMPAEHAVCWSCGAEVASDVMAERAETAPAQTDREIDASTGPIAQYESHAAKGRLSTILYLALYAGLFFFAIRSMRCSVLGVL